MLVSVFGQPEKTFRYDYKLALSSSLLFYEAQRSGLLPLDNAIPWRNDSCLNDRGANGEDLTGGYFTSECSITDAYTKVAIPLYSNPMASKYSFVVPETVSPAFN